MTMTIRCNFFNKLNPNLNRDLIDQNSSTKQLSVQVVIFVSKISSRAQLTRTHKSIVLSSADTTAPIQLNLTLLKSRFSSKNKNSTKHALLTKLSQHNLTRLSRLNGQKLKQKKEQSKKLHPRNIHDIIKLVSLVLLCTNSGYLTISQSM